MIKIGLTDFTPADKIIEIRDKKEVIKAKYAISATDILKCTLMNEHYIEISFQYNRYIAFKRSDYILWNGSKYTLREDYIPEQVNKRKYDYTLRFEAVEMLFQDIQYYYLNQSLKESEWRLAGNPEYFIKIAVDNANRYFKVTDFQIGVIEPTEVKDIIFDTNTNTFDALTQIAEAYESEWYMTGKTINLVKKVSFGAEVDFETEVSILSMSRSEGENSKKYTRILALGSERNLPKDYRGSSTGEGVDAVYPKRLRIPASKGDVIDAYPNMSPDEVVEGTVIFDEVYPKRVGTIQAVGTIEYTDTDEDTGEVTKWNAFKIKDSGINFKEEYLLPGEELRLSMQSGDLNGFDFALKFHKDGFSKTDNSQYFEIVRSEDYGKKLPNDTMKPKAGDKYVLYGFNIALVSNQYVPAGELELFDTASAWLQKQLQDTSVYDCPTVIDYFKKNEMDLDLGQKIRLIKDAGGNRNLLIRRNEKENSMIDKDGVIFSFSGSNLMDGFISVTAKEYLSFSKYGSNAPNDSYFRFAYFKEDGVTVVSRKAIATDKFKEVVPAGATLLRVSYPAKCQVKIERGDKVTEWALSPEDETNMIRSSRIMGFEKKLVNKYDATYTVGDNSAYSRLAAIEKDLKEMQYAGVVYENTGSGGVYLIKQFDTTTPSDFNAYSAKASDAKYFNKQTGGGILGDTLFQKNMQVQGSAISDVFQNSTFTAGQLGNGFQIKRDANGQSYMEVDNLMVRRETVFNKLTIAEIKSVGGSILLSLANMAVSKVEDKTSAWRCYFDNLDGTVPNDFAVNDQVICRKFTGKNIKYYWSKVTSVGLNFIEISKTDKDGTGVPSVADEIIQLGNRSDINRQYAIMLSAYGSDAPSIKQYAGISSYDLTDKEVTAISPKGNKFTGSFTVSTNGTTAPVYKERQVFVNGTVYYLNDRVSYLGSYWVCIVNSTITTPSETSLAWRKDTAGQTDISNAVNNIEIGGRNLFTNSNKPTKGSVGGNGYVTNTLLSTGELKIEVNIPNQGGSGLSHSMFNSGNHKFLESELKEGDDIVISYWMRSDDSTYIPPCYIRTEMGYGAMTGSMTTAYSQFYRVAKYKKNANNYFNFHLQFDKSGTYYLKSVKIEKGNKHTGWTPAPEDTEKEIQAAEAKASQAQIDADKANSQITDIANDNKFTPNEKQIIAKDWGNIQKEYPNAIAEAQKFGIATSSYSESYNLLKSYIEPLLLDLTTTNDIVGTTFRLRFNTYHDEYVKLLNAISTKTKELADTAQNSANNAQSTANQAKTDAISAQSTANKAQSDANTANNLLSDIASDNKLTPNEKQETKKEWDTIVSEYPKNIAQATKFGVSSATYTTAYNALSSYITPLLSNLGTTSDIDGATFRTNFKTYYDARTDLLNAISVKAKELADAAQVAADKAQKEAEKVRTEYKADFVILDTKIASKVSQADFNILGNRVSTAESSITQLSDSITSVVEKVENISFGGRNYLRNYKGLPSSINTSYVDDDIKGKVILTSQNTTFWYNKYTTSIPAGTEVTFSISCRTVTGSANITQYLNSQNSHVKVGTATTEWQILKLTRTLKGDLKTTDILHMGTIPSDGLLIEYIQLEIGNKASSGQPAPEDIEKQIQVADTKAQQAQSDANTAKVDAISAQSTANKAQSDANTANNLLSDIASDNKLTPNEKQETKKEWDGILSEYPKNIAQDTKFGVSSAAYTTAYNTLSSYITPLLANLGTTSDVNGATFRATFKAYYDARTDLLNNISVKTKDLADAAQSSANNAQNTADSKNRSYYQDAVPAAPSGGHKPGDLWYKTSMVDSSGNVNADTSKNIYQLQYRWDGSVWRQVNWSVSKSKIEQTDSSISMIVEKTGINSVGAGSSLFSMIKQTEESITLEVSKIKIGGRNYFSAGTYIGFVIGGGTLENRYNNGVTVKAITGTPELRLYNVIKSKGWHTISGYVKTDQSSLKTMMIQFNDLAWKSYQVNNQEIFFEYSFNVPNYNDVYSFVDISFASIATYYLRDIKIEEGNKPTDWTPAPEDVQGGIDKAQNTADSKTTIDEVKAGLVVTAEGINVFGETFTVNSLMIAKAIEAQSLNVGGNMTINQDGSINIANGKIRLNDDGSGRLANGNIVWDVNGNVTVLGKFETDRNGNRIIIDPNLNTIRMINSLNGESCEVLNIGWEDVGFGILRPTILMKEYVDDGSSVRGSIIVSPFTFGMYRDGRSDLPFIEIAGGWTSKRIKLSDYSLPSSKPSVKGTLWRDGEVIKIVT